MIVKTIKVKLYTFDELSDEVKEKVLEEYRGINIDFDDWYEGIMLIWKEELEKLGYDDVKIYFSGFYRQGDGACFEASVNIPKWIKAHKASNRFKKLLNEYNNGADVLIRITHRRSDYYSTSTDVDYEGYDLSDKAYEQLEEMVKWIEEEERKELGNKIYNDLEKEYEYLVSDEAVRETIIANDFMFTEGGERKIYID